MKTLEIGELESGLREYLATLVDGEEIEVLDGGVQVARILPVLPTPLTSGPDASQRGEDELEVSRGNGKIDIKTLLSLSRPNVSAEAMKEALDWARSDRF